MSENQPNPSSAPQAAPAVPASPQPVQVHPPQVVVKTSSGFGRFFAWLGWAGFLFCIPTLMSMSTAYKDYFNTTGDIQEKFHSGNKSATDKIAIIQCTGAIMQGAGGYVKNQIDRVKNDENVKAIVLRINSPGGSVSASDYLYHHLCDLRDDKQVPVVVSMGGLAASGGYYIAMAVGDQEKSIYAEPTTTTGSIGVIVPHYNVHGFLTSLLIKDDSVVSHARKQLLSMTKEESEEHRAIIQKYVDESFARFKDIVKSGRPAFRENDEALVELATGEIFSATAAAENGLVDEIGFIEDAISRAAELAELDVEDARVIKYQERLGIRDALGLTQAQTPQLSVEMFTPRAYYLWTTFPGIASLTGH